MRLAREEQPHARIPRSRRRGPGAARVARSRARGAARPPRLRRLWPGRNLAPFRRADAGRAGRIPRGGAAGKLGVRWEPTEFQRAYNEGRSTQVPVNPAVRVKGRFARHLRYQDGSCGLSDGLRELDRRRSLRSPSSVAAPLSRGLTASSGACRRMWISRSCRAPAAASVSRSALRRWLDHLRLRVSAAALQAAGFAFDAADKSPAGGHKACEGAKPDGGRGSGQRLSLVTRLSP
jgi:hypothetical protein